MNTRIFLLTTALAFTPFAQAMAVDNLATPTGENVIAGSATFDRPAAGQLNVNQGSHRAVIDWDRFDIGVDATTEFFQPNANSLAVNRVVSGADPTQILGTLRANGNLMVLDRNGVIFGPDSHVDVNGIIASSGDVAVADVIDGGDLTITGATDGVIENAGTISVADAGLAALVGPTVRNSGTINAKFGRVALASGSQATVDFFGDNLIELAVDSETEHALIENGGDILAEGGRVTITTAVAKDIVDNSINMDGLVDVSSITQEAGRIILAGAEDVTVGGRLLANSEVAGGRVSIDAGDIGIEDTGLIQANSSFDGPAGRVDLNADRSIDSQGRVHANGEEDGGRVNIAAGDNVNLGGQVQARATGIGTGGRINITNGGDEIRIAGQISANGIDDGGFVRVVAENNLTMTEDAGISATTLSTGQGGRINLDAGNDIVLDGTINIDGQEGGGRVYASADNDLTSNGLITGTSGIIGTGGAALLSARGKTVVDGDIVVDGTSGGGVISVSGNGVDLTANSNLNARGIESELPEVTHNDGGRISVFSSLGDLNADGGINADGFDNGFGAVRMTGNNINITGQVTSRGINSGKGGTVLASASNDLSLTGSIDTSGVDGGGLVRLGADNEVDAGATSLINNNAVTNGNGGHVLLKGAVHNTFAGRINSRGGSVSGDGGYVGISPPNTVTGIVDVSAPNGNPGVFNN